ncbi:ATPase [Paramyrothecium foliicola]|nr:ATPase [Paramyrothecium foliicola]
MSTVPRLRFALFGLGRLGVIRARILAYQQPLIELVAVCDTKPDTDAWAASNLPPTVRHFKDPEECIGFKSISQGRIDQLDQRLGQVDRLVESLLTKEQTDRVPQVTGSSAVSMSSRFSSSPLQVVTPPAARAAEDFITLPLRSTNNDIQEAGHGPKAISAQQEGLAPEEGPSSLSAHSSFAIDFLHHFASTDQGNGLNIETQELLDSLRQIVSALKGQPPSPALLFPFANPKVSQSHTSGQMPPIQTTVSTIHRAQGLFCLKYTANDCIATHKKEDMVVMDYCRQTVKLAEIAGKTFEELYSAHALSLPRETRTMRMLALNEELSKVHSESLDTMASLSGSATGQYAKQLIEQSSVSDQVLWHSVATLLQRAETDTMNGFTNQCITSARTALEYHRSFVRNFGQNFGLRSTTLVYSYMNWTILFSPFIPFIVLFCHIIETGNGEDLGRLGDFVRSIQSVCDDSNTIANHYRLFQVFHSVAVRYTEIKSAPAPLRPEELEFRGEMDGFLRTMGFQTHQNLVAEDRDANAGDQVGSPSGFHMAPSVEMCDGLERTMQVSQTGNWFTLSQQMMDLLDNDEVDQPHVSSTGKDEIPASLHFDAGDSDSATDHQGTNMEQEIHELARRFTSQSLGPRNLFPLNQQGPLDPHSDKFNPRMWAKAFYSQRENTGSDVPPRKSGLAFRNLSVHGYGTATDFQKTVGNISLNATAIFSGILGREKQRIDILRDLEGIVDAGEMLVVLGPPGSGCSTMLKTISGDTHGLHVDDASTMNYRGITAEQMRSNFRGEAIYTAEVDAHSPHMTVGDTLYFAARARCPRQIPDNTSRKEYAEHLRDVTMAMFGIAHTKKTRVGDDFIRGVSGGERKRVTIAEAALSYSPLQCWDNSTRGLDSANALEFCRTLRVQADILGTTACVALYQASQDAYNVFDKVIVLYEGRQIYFGRTTEAKAYFEALGFVCPEQQTTADFLTSMTSHQERVIRPGFEGKTPRTPEDFANAWKNSKDRSQLDADITRYMADHPFNDKHYNEFLASRRQDQSRNQRHNSPFTLSYWGQFRLTLWRSWLLFIGDPSTTVTMFVMNVVQALILSSLFYNLSKDSNTIARRGMLLFFVVLTNAFASMLEIMTLYAKRKVIEKHARYALYHPSAEAIAAIICDMPYKIINCIITNMTIYFMTNLRRDAGHFFFFLLTIFICTLTMSMMFRLMGSLTKTIAQALAPASVILLVIMLYTGYAIKVQNMQVWLGWLRWLNPIHYGFESLMLNEFTGRSFPCASFVPQGEDYSFVAGSQRICSVAGSLSGESLVQGTVYLDVAYGYVNSHKWRNLGIMIAFMLVFFLCHLVATEYVASERSRGEVLVFTRKAIAQRQKNPGKDTESTSFRQVVAAQSDNGPASIESQQSIFHWSNVCYDVNVGKETRRILDHVDGWVKPGTLTALMGVSGAGKTTLLDALASRITMGVVSGDMLVDGNPRDQSFQRKTGYVTQQDLHLYTATVREAITFSALLRQPAKYTHKEKLAYVDTIIALLDMQEYSDAIIGTLGEGLNVEQRKRLTIGVELASRPELLVFLDEPTSGLDSQTSWSICNLMEKLTKNGQAILCTIHQPSAMLFQRFDRLLLLAKGGKTVYFGDIGKNSNILTSYFVRNGAPPLPVDANPAEYMLEVIGAAPGAHTEIDWPAVWRISPEYQDVQRELDRLASNPKMKNTESSQSPIEYTEFAAGYTLQFKEVSRRAFQQYWRSPGYIYPKAFLSMGAALFIGLSFLNVNNTQSGLQNQVFGVFVFLTVFSQLVDQIMPVFVSQRMMYEARERPAKAYSWKAFLCANMLVELFYNTVLSVGSFLLWYFPMGLYRNAQETGTEHSRAVTICLFIWVFFLFTTSFAFLCIAGISEADMAGGIVGLLTIMMFTFCGVVATPEQMPGFWIFMYRCNPFTYFVDGFLSTALANAGATCATNEYLRFEPPNGSTCGDYMMRYLETSGGFLKDPLSTSQCEFCPIAETNTFLRGVNITFVNRWRNFGILWVFVIFNLAAATFLYWLYINSMDT